MRVSLGAIFCGMSGPAIVNARRLVVVQLCRGVVVEPAAGVVPEPAAAIVVKALKERGKKA
jgi:hypothetical protein